MEVIGLWKKKTKPTNQPNNYQNLDILKTPVLREKTENVTKTHSKNCRKQTNRLLQPPD